MELQFNSCFSVPKSIIGMLHLPPLPGALRHRKTTLEMIIDKTVSSAQLLADGGVDGLLIENTSNDPFQREGTEPHTVAALTLIVNAIKGFFIGP